MHFWDSMFKKFATSQEFRDDLRVRYPDCEMLNNNSNNNSMNDVTISSNETDDYYILTEDEQQAEVLRIKIEVCMYIVCFLIGGPLNILSLKRSLRAFRAHKAKSQILLLRITLNIADLMTLFLYVPKQIIWLITYQWYGGEILCRICAFFSTFSFYLNSYVIACIAIDRVYGAYNISSLNAHRKAYIRCRNLLAFGWIWSFVLAVPNFVVFRTTLPFPHLKDYEQCATIFMIFVHDMSNEYTNDSTTEARRIEIDKMAADMRLYERAYAVSHFLFVFWIPCTIIICSYIVVLLILQGHLKQEKASNCCFKFNTNKSCMLRSTSKENIAFEYTESRGSVLTKSSRSSSTKFGAMAVSTIHKAKQHAKRQAAMIIIAYLCIWSPYNFFTVLNVLGVPVMEELRNFLSFLNAGICFNTIVNPIIYGVFRKR
ncbi:unnamed protein product [Caenorhabditis bovis]|uniref:G-protein coupled receptors family 1 profile domain-containing protein n=1 Tax=Caenorhabditis bovis TaxID=2654633 RepID=A0A8S1EHE7_9PELO|nr:unnamed protein product [Caenorhabditis bovis]